MRYTAILATLGWIATLGLAPAAPAADETELYTGLDETLLFEQCGIDVQDVAMGMEGGEGGISGLKRHAVAAYSFGDRRVMHIDGKPYPGMWTGQVGIGVYPSVGEAQAVYRASTMNALGRNFPAPPGAAIGDEAYWRHNREDLEGAEARVVFRRGNIFISVRASQAPSEVVALARQIDGLIEGNREIAPRGRFEPTPEIVDTGVPTRLAVRPMKVQVPPIGDGEPGEETRWQNPRGTSQTMAFVQIEPEFRGVGDVDQLWASLLPAEQSHISHLLDMQGPRSRYFQKSRQHTQCYYVPIGPERLRRVMREEAAGDAVDGRLLMCVEVPNQFEAKRLKLTLFAVTDYNVALQRDVEVFVERGNWPVVRDGLAKWDR